MGRWFRFFLAILLGFLIGLFYGWVVRPVRYVDTTPDTLRQDYSTDYVLMVAEAYAGDGNLPVAVRRLAILGDRLPTEMVAEAIQFATQIGYAGIDLDRMQALEADLKTWNPVIEAPQP